MKRPVFILTVWTVKKPDSKINKRLYSFMI